MGGDHVLLDTVVVPGTTFLELALTAAAETGCDTVEELTLEAPLVLDGEGAFELQLLVEEAEESGQHAFAIYSRPQGELTTDADFESAAWTRHASGMLAVGLQSQARRSSSWPPRPGHPRAPSPSRSSRLYARLSAAGFAYGPAFTGIRAAWRRGAELFTEVALQQPYADEAARFQIHPALFDAALQGGATVLEGGEEVAGRGGMLFSWSGVSHYASGASSLRVRVTSAEGSAWSVAALDETGAPVVSVDAVTFRPVEAQQLARAGRRANDWLLGLEWVRVESRWTGAGPKPGDTRLRRASPFRPASRGAGGARRRRCGGALCGSARAERGCRGGRANARRGACRGASWWRGFGCCRRWWAGWASAYGTRGHA